MAKQKGLHKILGTVDDATYSKTKDGFRVQQKPGISRSTFLTHPNLALTRQNASEFGRAGKAASLLRLSMGELWRLGPDHRAFARLVKEMMRVVKSDPVHRRGERTVTDGNIELLQAFQFNRNANLQTVFPLMYSSAIDRASGQLSVSVPSFIPRQKIPVPEGATHFVIVATGSEIDFENNTYNMVETFSAVLPWNDTTIPAMSLEMELTSGSSLPLFLFLGIQFIVQVNGFNERMGDVSFNALSLIKVDGA
jgi:hypothetical protein